MVILTLNCGSSSVKYQVFEWDEQEVLASGIVERVTQEGSMIKHKAKGKDEYKLERSCPDHTKAIELILETIVNPTVGAIGNIHDVKAVGHRVVHGGEKFSQSVLVTDEVVQAFRDVQDLSPLHNPANIMGIEAARTVLPEVPHCAIMDTAWHQTMPKEAFLYALPYDWYTKHSVRRYGFHGTSFLYTAKRASVLLGKNPFETNIIIAHIGNGSSINAVRNGVSVDTSMGMTPLEGLIMGTRCGDIDPAIPFYMMRRLGVSGDDMEMMLNRRSGVLGITEEWVDRRDIEVAAEEGHERALLTIAMEGYRIKQYIGAYSAILGRVDAVVFTAGVGEMGPPIREASVGGLANIGIKLDPEKNLVSMTRNAETDISTDDSPVRIFVIPTDEELVMTEDTYAIMKGNYDTHTHFTYTFQKKDYVNKQRVRNIDRDIQKRPGLAKIIARPAG